MARIARAGAVLFSLSLLGGYVVYTQQNANANAGSAAQSAEAIEVDLVPTPEQVEAFSTVLMPGSKDGLLSIPSSGTPVPYAAPSGDKPKTLISGSKAFSGPVFTIPSPLPLGLSPEGANPMVMPGSKSGRLILPAPTEAKSGSPPNAPASKPAVIEPQPSAEVVPAANDAALPTESKSGLVDLQYAGSRPALLSTTESARDVPVMIMPGSTSGAILIPMPPLYLSKEKIREREAEVRLNWGSHLEDPSDDLLPRPPEPEGRASIPPVDANNSLTPVAAMDLASTVFAPILPTVRPIGMLPLVMPGSGSGAISIPMPPLYTSKEKIMEYEARSRNGMILENGEGVPEIVHLEDFLPRPPEPEGRANLPPAPNPDQSNSESPNKSPR